MSQTLPAKNKLLGAHPYELPGNYNTPENVLKMLSRHTNLGTTWLMILKIKPCVLFQIHISLVFSIPLPFISHLHSTMGSTWRHWDTEETQELFLAPTLPSQPADAVPSVQYPTFGALSPGLHPPSSSRLHPFQGATAAPSLSTSLPSPRVQAQEAGDLWWFLLKELLPSSWLSSR